MSDAVIAGIVSAAVGALLGAAVSLYVASQQSRTQLQLLQAKVAAQQEQLREQRQWDAVSSAIPAVAAVLARVDPNLGLRKDELYGLGDIGTSRPRRSTCTFHGWESTAGARKR